eukprot:m.49562 g.49562  ORF g.49562 m.49562 type:complete len:203 (+) comp12835_c0_seq1:38-646(+)
MGQLLATYNQAATQPLLLDPMTVSLDHLLKAIDEVNTITNVLVDSHGNRLFFSVRDEPDVTTLFWRSLLRVYCETVSSTTGIAQKARAYNLRQFCQLYTFIVEQRPEELAQANMRASVLLNVLPDDDDDNTCPVCMDRRLEQILPCSHGFCGECINTWSAQSQRCPLCRQDISEEEERWQLTQRPPTEDISDYINAAAEPES